MVDPVSKESRLVIRHESNMKVLKESSISRNLPFKISQVDLKAPSRSNGDCITLSILGGAKLEPSIPEKPKLRQHDREFALLFFILVDIDDQRESHHQLVKHHAVEIWPGQSRHV